MKTFPSSQILNSDWMSHHVNFDFEIAVEHFFGTLYYKQEILHQMKYVTYIRNNI